MRECVGNVTDTVGRRKKKTKERSQDGRMSSWVGMSCKEEWIAFDVLSSDAGRGQNTPLSLYALD